MQHTVHVCRYYELWSVKLYQTFYFPKQLRGSLLFINKQKERGFFSPNGEAEVYALLYVRPSMHNAHVYACSFNAEMYALRYLYSMLKAKMCALLYARPLAAYLDAQSGNVWYTIWALSCMLKAEMYALLYAHAPLHICRHKAEIYDLLHSPQPLHICIYPSKLKCMLSDLRTHPCIFVCSKLKCMLFKCAPAYLYALKLKCMVFYMRTRSCIFVCFKDYMYAFLYVYSPLHICILKAEMYALLVYAYLPLHICMLVKSLVDNGQKCIKWV